jgi:hypothetical protein
MFAVGCGRRAPLERSRTIHASTLLGVQTVNQWRLWWVNFGGSLLGQRLFFRPPVLEPNLYASGCHVKFSGEIRAHDAIWFLVVGKGLFEDLELGLCRSLSVFYLVGNVRIELFEVDERGIYAWGNDVWDAGAWERVVARVVHGSAGGGGEG